MIHSSGWYSSSVLFTISYIGARLTNSHRIHLSLLFEEINSAPKMADVGAAESLVGADRVPASIDTAKLQTQEAELRQADNSTDNRMSGACYW